MIDIKLRLKGGMDRQFDMDIETDGQKRLKELHNALLKTQEYTTSIKTEKRDGESKFVDLSSDTIYKSLEHIFRNKEVDIINPEYSSINNLFSENKEAVNDAINELIINIAGIKANLILGNLEEVSINNPAIQKPIIFVTATHCRDRNMNKEISKQVRNGFDYGYHWVCLVILPGNFKGLLKQVDTPIKHEQVLLFDSIRSRRELPSEFKRKMTEVWNRKEQHSERNENIYASLPPSLDKQASFTSRNYYNQQSHNSCGYWAMFNSIMAVLTGSGEFYDNMHAFSANNWEQNHLAELHIRKVLEMHVPNLKNDEYKEPPKAKKTDEEKNQGNSKNSRTHVGQKLKRDGTPDRRCKQAREHNAANGESNTPRTENKNQKRGRSISEKENQTISPIISPDVGKKLRREEKTVTNQPSILSFLTKLNTESISKPDIDVQKYLNINDNVEIVTEENTKNEEIFKEVLNQKESLQSNIETNKMTKKRDGVEAETNYKEGDHTSASSSILDSTKEDPINTLHKELHDNYLNKLHMMYERLTRLEIIDENSIKNIEFLTKNISKFTSHMEGTVAGLIHGTMVIYLQNSLSKVTEHHNYSHKKLQNDELKITDEKNQIRKMEQRLEDMQSEIKTLKSQIEGSNKPQKERIDEEDTKSDEKYETSYKNEELHRTITEKVDAHSKRYKNK